MGHSLDASFADPAGFRLRPPLSPPPLLPVPVLGIWGQADRTHRKSDPAGGLALAPWSRLVSLEGVGHFPDLERPERFADEVLRFVAEVTP